MRKEAFYPFLFSALTFLGTSGCIGEGGSKVSSETPIVTDNELDQDLRRLLVRRPDYKAIYDKARQRDLGFVLFTIENAKEDIKVSFTRVDTDLGSDELDHQELLAAPGTDSIFAATSCTGRYRVQISFIGGEYQSIPVPDLFTREPSDTFILRPSSCARPIRVVFPF